MIAVGFIVLAIVGGSGSKKGDESAAPSPDHHGRGAGQLERLRRSRPPPRNPNPNRIATKRRAPTPKNSAIPPSRPRNTTRIGGPDPVANAAAAALAVFPSTNEKQRPVAVALVSTEDWAGAIAAGVLMAEPIRAPLLYGEAEGVPDATDEAL